jgi:nucleoside-diphosphate-sugar epimerase
MMECKRMLLTGGGEFICSHLCRHLLDEGHDVTLPLYLEVDQIHKRIYAVFHRQDFLKLIINVMSNITLLMPLLLALKKYLNKRGAA